MTRPRMHRWIKTDCGRAKLAELQQHQGTSAKIRMAWFVLIAAIRDWSLPNPDQAPNSKGLQPINSAGRFDVAQLVLEDMRANIKKAFPKINLDDLNKITKSMWNNYGRVFAEYMFIKNFREDKSNKKIEIEGQGILEDIKKENKSVIFVSGHLSNFELMAMHIEKSGIKLSAIYRPLNNIFLNPLMEYLRKKYICPNQIKKGRSGLRELIYKFKDQNSIALMVDQRVSEGISVNLFDKPALTTTIPAQMVLRYNCKIVPVEIKRINNIHFEIKINNPVSFEKKDNKIDEITLKINQILEKMILANPKQWIWPHNRWK